MPGRLSAQSGNRVIAVASAWLKPLFRSHPWTRCHGSRFRGACGGPLTLGGGG